MSFHQRITRFWNRLLGRREAPSPAAEWLAVRDRALPTEVLETHFHAWKTHDLDLLLATLSPERARLYGDVRTVDKRRLTVADVQLVSVKEATAAMPLPAFAHRYRSHLVLRVEYDLTLVDRERRRDPTLKEGRDWAYYILVTESRGKPWLIADWGR